MAGFGFDSETLRAAGAVDEGNHGCDLAAITGFGNKEKREKW